MIKDFIKRLNDLGYYELNDNFKLAQITDEDYLNISTINKYKCVIYISTRTSFPWRIRKIVFIDSKIIDEVLY